MADDAERAQERIENIEAGGIAIATEKSKNMRALVPIKECYNCGLTLNAGRVFCDKDCQDDYYHLLDREKANGI